MPPQELFEQLDSDKSGSISFEELTAGLRKQGYVLSDSEIEQLMRKAREGHGNGGGRGGRRKVQGPAQAGIRVEREQE